MSTRLKLIKKVVFVLIVLNINFCFSSESGGQAGAFLRIPVGARPAGLGNAFVAVANDASALYFNPGGIYQLEGTTFSGMYSLMSMDRNFYQGSLIYSHESYGSFGLMFTCFTVGKIDGRDLSGNQTGDFSNNEIAFSLTYGRKIISFLGLGGSIKYIHHSLDNYKATGLGFDVGAFSKFELEDLFINQISFGISLSNLSASLKWDTDSSLEETIPLTLRYGAGLQFTLSKVRFLLAGGITQTTDEKQKVNAGVETWLIKNFGIRVGLDGKDIIFGVSLKFNDFQFDYGFCPDVLDQGATNKIGIQFNLK